MKYIFKLIVAGSIVASAGGVAAGSSGQKALYPPVPKVNKNTAIPQKGPLAVRPALGKNSGVVSRSAGGKSGAGDGGPRFGVERPAPERQIPDTPAAGTAGPAGANRTE